MSETYPPAASCVPIVMLGSATLAHLNRWTAKQLPGYEYLPLVGVAFSEAVLGPWATAGQLRLTGQTAVWAYALDDYVEREVADLATLDEFVDRCDTVVRTGRRDDGNPLLASLSTCQQELMELPAYPPLAELWAEKFASCMLAQRYDWVVGRARGTGDPQGTDVAEYLDHADSISIWQVHLPRWVVYGGSELPRHLDVLVPALDDVTVAARLANDLATISRERDEPGQNNVLMYDVDEDWVREELAGRVAAVRQRLAPLLAESFLPAVGLVRLAEYAVGIYDGHDLRLATAGRDRA